MAVNKQWLWTFPGLRSALVAKRHLRSNGNPIEEEWPYRDFGQNERRKGRLRCEFQKYLGKWMGRKTQL